jgi:O-antigen ligase
MGLVLLGIAQAVYGLGQYVHVFSNASSDFRIVGSFDNPAGFAAALVAVFPFALVLIRSDKMGCRVLGVIGAIVLMEAIVLSHSRAGMVALVVVTAWWCWNGSNIQWFSRFSKKLKLGIAGLLLLGVVAGLYSIKKDSADGRILIWQCSGQMVMDKPLLGHGIGGFQRE